MKYQIYNQDSINISGFVNTNFVDAIITDPPYGINFKNQDWDKKLPNIKIWEQCYQVLKPGGFMLVFSFPRMMHRIMCQLEDLGFEIKDVLFWVYLNGMPKIKNIGLEIDKELGVKSEIVGKYKYIQGYKDKDTFKQEKNKLSPTSKLGKVYNGAGIGLKPAYEPIILFQKPIEKKLSVSQNIIKYKTGVLNLEETRIPYQKGEKKVGHNPHPLGRVPSNIIRTKPFFDNYDKFFVVPKVRGKEKKITENLKNTHPTIKPIELMEHLVKLLSFKNQIILDPFMGSGSTGVAALKNNRKFIGFEINKDYFNLAKIRLSGL